MLPHLDAAYSLALWLVRESHEAEDIVQDAYMRAYEHFDRYSPGNARAWLLTIVRNQAYTWLSRRKQAGNLVSFDEIAHSQDDTASPFPASLRRTPESVVSTTTEIEAMWDLLNGLQPEFREVLLLREAQGYSYKEIAELTGVPQGTVMSRLSRARRYLLESLRQHQNRERAGGL